MKCLQRLSALLLIFFVKSAVAQEAGGSPVSSFDPAALFAPGFYTAPGDLFHSAQGTPGPAYWQNRVNYQIQATIDTAAGTLGGSEQIEYINNSPDSLHFLWLQMDQNTYRADARAAFAGPILQDAHTEGYVPDSVFIQSGSRLQKAEFTVTDTRLQIRLPRALAPRGTAITIFFRYHYSIPGAFGNRTDYFQTKNGKIFEIAQWFPRLCVYDNSSGWNTLPFLGAGEFYCEYGDIDYKVTVPWNMLVAGSGELLNPQEVFTPAGQARLEQARHSDQTIMIRKPEEVNDPKSRPVQKGMLTWHYRMNNTRDVAFGVSSAYIWDAAKVNLPEGKTSLAMSVYPAESRGHDAWDRATEYLKKSIEYFSRKWYVYPYSSAINEAGIAGGMEYPGIVFDGWTDKGPDLYWVTAHEIGHNWFPMIVGSDERTFGWMDEGFNTFIDVYASDDFNKGEFAPKRDGEFAPDKGNPADEIAKVLRDSLAVPVMTAADAVDEKYRHPITYFKTAFGLVLLREHILGPDRFDYAFSQYIREWAYKHPTPQDFFRSMENGAGENLAWFWRGWFLNNYRFDIALTGATYKENDQGKGIDISMALLNKMTFPCIMEITYKDGTKERKTIPVETWMHRSRFTFHQPVKSAVSSISLDPDKALPDENRENNRITMP